VSEPLKKSDRSWRDIADEASHEKDPKKLVQLAEELSRALDERDKKPDLPESELPPAKQQPGSPATIRRPA
jgi:hypothetical protein